MKYPAKWGVQIAGMIFQTRSKIEKEIRIKMEREILAYIKQNRMIGKNNVADTRACLKKAFCKMCVIICGIFCPDEGAVAGYGN